MKGEITGSVLSINTRKKPLKIRQRGWMRPYFDFTEFSIFTFDFSQFLVC